MSYPYQNHPSKIMIEIHFVLRTNGGPGCSSLEGFLQENGVRNNLQTEPEANSRSFKPAHQLVLGPSWSHSEREQLDEPLEHAVGRTARGHRVFAGHTGCESESQILTTAGHYEISDMALHTRTRTTSQSNWLGFFSNFLRSFRS